MKLLNQELHFFSLMKERLCDYYLFIHNSFLKYKTIG